MPSFKVLNHSTPHEAARAIAGGYGLIHHLVAFHPEATVELPPQLLCWDCSSGAGVALTIQNPGGWKFLLYQLSARNRWYVLSYVKP